MPVAVIVPVPNPPGKFLVLLAPRLSPLNAQIALEAFSPFLYSSRPRDGALVTNSTLVREAQGGA